MPLGLFGRQYVGVTKDPSSSSATSTLRLQEIPRAHAPPVPTQQGDLGENSSGGGEAALGFAAFGRSVH